jgi:short-subunit dehydrogenase
MNVASTAAFQPTPFIGVYGATKAFVLHWSLALNEELRGTGVRCMAVCPGPTSTQFFARAGLEARKVEGRFGQTSDQVVMEALRAMAAGRSLVVTGLRNKLAAALAAPMPKRLVARVAGKVIARYRLGRMRR